MNNQKATLFLLRLSIASVFLYAAIAAILQPFNWIGFIPQFATTIAPASVLLLLFSLYQLTLSIWIASGWRPFFPSLLAAFTLLAIIGANWGDIDILFRDFAIFFAALALATASYKKNKKNRK
ncbi:MAG TPA: hypothetical protein VFQ63_01425 [Patescibacteria group bacterium]|nr:hypothetical protein [Patescibacteria group bacterium]